MTARSPGASPTPSDGELLRRLHAQDVSALGALYERHASYVMGISFRIVGARHEAEEVVQDVFWQLWKTQIRYDPTRGRFTTWLYAMARNRSLDRVRRLGRAAGARPLAALAGAAGGDDPEAEAARSQRGRVVRVALAQLSDDQRRTIELAFYEGLTHSEIAERLEEPLGTVKSRIQRGMSRLRDLLGDGGVSA